MNEAMQHFKLIADYIEQYFERGQCGRLVVGCHDDIWSEFFIPELHSNARSASGGSFSYRFQAATPEQVEQMALRESAEYDAGVKQGLIREVVGEAHRNGRGQSACGGCCARWKSARCRRCLWAPTSWRRE